ncbi:MAG: glycosyltransferase family 2 protein [Acidobacteriota bacterium]
MDLSIVIPLLNEEQNLKELHQRLTKALVPLDLSYEIVMVDDGSTDRSFEILCDLQCLDPHLKIIKLRRNFGQHPATFAGFDNAKGDIVISMDSDLQNDPNDISKLLEVMRRGYDVVSGKRSDRKDPFLRRKLPSKFINRFISVRTGLVQTDTGCFLKAYTNRAAKEIAQFTEVGGFFTASIGLLGLKYTEVDVSHGVRANGGKSRYDLFTQLNQFMSLFTGYARRPFQVVELIGGTTLLIGMTLFLGNLINWVGSRNLVVLLLSFLIAGVGLLTGCAGIIGEYLIRIYHSSISKPRYLIEGIYEAKPALKQSAQRGDV